ncbi:MAG: hypothetical protein ACI8QC_003925 [Planctomycetota bacterium]|jgi:hypothetical protein
MSMRSAYLTLIALVIAIFFVTRSDIEQDVDSSIQAKSAVSEAGHRKVEANAPIMIPQLGPGAIRTALNSTEANTAAPPANKPAELPSSAAAGPLAAVLADWNAELMTKHLKVLEGEPTGSVGLLNAVDEVLTTAIAIDMELAGRALPLRRKGDPPIESPYRLQFLRNSRQYRFAEGEYVSWDRSRAFQSQEGGPPDPLPSDFILDVIALGKQANEIILQD